MKLAFRGIGAAAKRTFIFSLLLFRWVVGGGRKKAARNYMGRFTSFVLSFLASLHWEISNKLDEMLLKLLFSLIQRLFSFRRAFCLCTHTRTHTRRVGVGAYVYNTRHTHTLCRLLITLFSIVVCSIFPG